VEDLFPRYAGGKVKLRTRRFSGRCAKHKRYNPAVDGRGAIRGNCPRCNLLAEIFETAVKLNGLIRKFDPKHDDVKAPPKPPVTCDPRQLSLLE
jgi:hypothetical protein